MRIVTAKSSRRSSLPRCPDIVLSSKHRFAYSVTGFRRGIFRELLWTCAKLIHEVILRHEHANDATKNFSDASKSSPTVRENY